MDAKELLLKDLEHFAESMWRNEEIGEKRFSFFVTLVTAVIGGLVALGTSGSGPVRTTVVAAAGWAAAVLLVFGLMTYLRMLQRNRVTDEYQRTLKYLRKLLATRSEELDDYVVPRMRKSFLGKWLKGGYAETIGVINGMLLVALLVLLTPLKPWLAGVMGALLAGLLWMPGAVRRKGL